MGRCSPSALKPGNESTGVFFRLVHLVRDVERDRSELCCVRSYCGEICAHSFLSRPPSFRFSLYLFERNENQVKRIAKVAYDVAMKRGKRLCSVDKANVLDVSQV